MTVVGAAVVSLWEQVSPKRVPLGPQEPSSINWPLVYILVGIYFFLMVALSHLIERAG